MKAIKLEALNTTDDYTIFRGHDVNRVLTFGGQIELRKDILESMKQEGFRKSQPISCYLEEDGVLTIFDGHNRFACAKALGLPIHFIPYAKEDAITPLTYSSGQKAWMPKDFAAAYAAAKADYAEVIAFANAAEIPLATAFSMFSGELASSNNQYYKVRGGEFVIKDRVRPALVAAMLNAFREANPTSATRSTIFALSRCTFVEAFDPNRMIERVSRNPELAKAQRTATDAMRMLEVIYNRNLKSDYFYLAAEADKAARARNVIGKRPTKSESPQYQ